VIRGVPARAFENDPGWGQHLAQAVFAAFWAAFQWFISK